MYIRLVPLAARGGFLGRSELSYSNVLEPKLEKTRYDDFHHVRTTNIKRYFMKTVGKYNWWYKIFWFNHPPLKEKLELKILMSGNII